MSGGTGVPPVSVESPKDDAGMVLPMVADSSAPGNRELHFTQNRLPPGLVWPQLGQAIRDFIAF
jgi:hypothetical protein